MGGHSRHATGSNPQMTEAQWQEIVEQLAGLGGWMHYHTRDSRGSVAGFPDLVLIRSPELLFVELKRQGKDPTAEQDRWLTALEGVADAVIAATQAVVAGRDEAPGHRPLLPVVEVHVWRPGDLPRVQDRLGRRRVG